MKTLSHAARFTSTLAMALFSLASAARAFEIDFNFHASTSSLTDVQGAFEEGARRWEQLLADPIRITIDVRMSEELGFSAAAATATIDQEVSYAEIRSALLADASTPVDSAAIDHLPAGSEVVFRTLAPDRSSIVNSGHNPINQILLISNANAQALGLTVAGPAAGEIELSQLIYDFELYDSDPADGIDGLDLVGIAMHEIAHVLGFFSGVDSIDLVFAPDLTPEEAAGLPTPDELNEYTILSPLDLFRYSTASGGTLDLTPGADAYFSLDGGRTSMGPFSTGEFNGDGYQASHWRGELGLMAAETLLDTGNEITGLDLIAMDAIGWDARPVPEPGVTVFVITLLSSSIVLRRCKTLPFAAAGTFCLENQPPR